MNVPEILNGIPRGWVRGESNNSDASASDPTGSTQSDTLFAHYDFLS
jgi:hypothetical protein